MYVIKRLDQNGGYFAGPGCSKSWTPNPRLAYKYNSLAAAHAEVCAENEIVIPFDCIVIPFDC